MDDRFPFDEDPGTGAITTVHVLDHGHPILFASHDADDGPGGAWHRESMPPEEDDEERFA